MKVILVYMKSSPTTTLIVLLIATIISVISKWLIFKKAQKPGWYSIIPVLNMYKLFEMAGMKGKYVFWLFLPFIGWGIYLIYYIQFSFKLAKSFEKGTIFGIGILLLMPIFLLILALDKNTKYNASANGLKIQNPIMGNPYIEHNHENNQSQKPTIPQNNQNNNMGNPY